MATTIYVPLQLSDVQEGLLRQLCATFNISEDEACRAMVEYGFKRVATGIPLHDSVLVSLESDDSARRTLHARLNSVALAAEKAVADSLATLQVHAAIQSSMRISNPALAPEAPQSA